ncbi:MAG: hypothetical protein IJV06_00975 [Bacteroidaceae bacterium]|nr:hypothetical protein [Bacteroidaceae bacterium]
MKTIVSFWLLLAATMLPATNRAQTINGDLNHNNTLDVGDVTMLIDGYLTGESELISVNPFEESNDRIVGTWYKSPTESITFREDGTTDYLPDCTYKYLPLQSRIIFLNADGIPVTSLVVPYITKNFIAVLPLGSNDFVIYTTAELQPLNNGYEYVDLGLSVKWATMNVGASSPEDYGDYFAWGETTTKKPPYNWANYKFGNHYTLTKYCTAENCGIVDNKTKLELCDDAASVNWGGTWRIPSIEEIKELQEKCTWTWTSLNGVNGMNVLGPSGKSIFLPAAGYYFYPDDEWPNDVRKSGAFWSNSLGSDYRLPYYASGFYFSPEYKYFTAPYRYEGRSIRAVCQ